MDLGTLKTFFGWCAVLNYGVMILWASMFFIARDMVVGWHARLFDIEPERVRAYHFQFIGQFKILVFLFALAPWLTLVILGA